MNSKTSICKNKENASSELIILKISKFVAGNIDCISLNFPEAYLQICSSDFGDSLCFFLV